MLPIGSTVHSSTATCATHIGHSASQRAYTGLFRQLDALWVALEAFGYTMETIWVCTVVPIASLGWHMSGTVVPIASTGCPIDMHWMPYMSGTGGPLASTGGRMCILEALWVALELGPIDSTVLYW